MNEADEQAERRAARLPDVERELYETFKRQGLAPRAALRATEGRGGPMPSADPFEEVRESFERMGLDRDAATVAAAGRHETEHAARRAFREVRQAAGSRTAKFDGEIDRVERQIGVSTERYLREGLDAESAHRKAAELWNAELGTVLDGASPPATISEQQRKHLVNLIARGTSLREAIGEVTGEVK